MSRLEGSVVVDLGFGDAGKGMVTDALVRRTNASCVVRFNGGAQAGHTVVLPDGRFHTFAQVGAGAFRPGVATLLAPEVVVHPTGLALELDALRAKDVGDAGERLHLHRECRVITPIHQAIGRLRERARGHGRHGSTGVGVGECVRADLAGVRVDVATLLDDDRTRSALDALIAYARAELAALEPSLPDTEDVHAELPLAREPRFFWAYLERARACFARVRRIDDAGARALLRGGPVVFEGAQGVLLDERHGFHPHTSWGDCTVGGVARLASRLGMEPALARYGVLRTYAVRHGDGPLPSERAELARALLEPHNVEGPFQGAVRKGLRDLVLDRYALACVGELDALAFTHVDALPVHGTMGYVDAYASGPGERDRSQASGIDRGNDAHLGFRRDGAGFVVALAPFEVFEAGRAEARTQALKNVVPRVVPSLPTDPRDFADFAAGALGLPVAFVADGPTHLHLKPHAAWRA